MRFLCFPAWAADFVPLEPGNEWVYRNPALGDTFRVSVGLPVLLNDRVYHPLDGYTESRLLVRYNDRGDLVMVNEENYAESIVTSFTPLDRAWWQAHGRACDQEGQTAETREVYDGPAGPIRGVLRLRYRTHSCADYGTESELFAENIGMVQRVSTTIAGPRTYDLVYARVGRLIVEASAHTRFTVTVDQTQGSELLRATMRLQLEPASAPLKLVFPTSQEYEVVLRDEAGNVVWRFSDSAVFLQALTHKTYHGEWSTTVMIPRPPLTGQPREAIYTVHAFLPTIEPSFSAVVPVTVTAGR
ncbi:MAG: BsuPI-related putative proteinase inhibitor [Bryobacteraceae bacterium]|nr:BsuPI-related putative proteinase inhibitor [Bryobacteraceae bacterium]